MPLEGPLHELGIHDVFQLLDLGRKTGTLRISDAPRGRSGVICVERGAVVNAAVDGTAFDLGAVLLRAGRITLEEYREAGRRREAGDPRGPGRLLVALGAVSLREVERQLRRHVEETVFELMGWSDGYFLFEDAPCGLPATEVPVRIPIEVLLMEGARRIDEWSRMASLVPDMGVVPSFRLDLPPETTLDLTPFEWEVLAAVDGHRSAAEVAAAVGSGEFEAARALFGLASGGVIVLSRPGPDRGAPVVAALLEAGRVHFAAGRFEAAADAFREALARDPGMLAAERWLGRAEAARGRFAEALACWERWDDPARLSLEEQAFADDVARWREAARVLAAAMEPTA